jgi:hypothetical protein
LDLTTNSQILLFHRLVDEPEQITSVPLILAEGFRLTVTALKLDVPFEQPTGNTVTFPLEVLKVTEIESPP